MRREEPSNYERLVNAPFLLLLLLLHIISSLGIPDRFIYFFFLDIADSTASEGWHKVCGDRVSKEKQLSPLRQSQHASHLTLIKGEH